MDAHVKYSSCFPSSARKALEAAIRYISCTKLVQYQMVTISRFFKMCYGLRYFVTTRSRWIRAYSLNHWAIIKYNQIGWYKSINSLLITGYKCVCLFGIQKLPLFLCPVLFVRSRQSLSLKQTHRNYIIWNDVTIVNRH